MSVVSTAQQNIGKLCVTRKTEHVRDSGSIAYCFWHYEAILTVLGENHKPSNFWATVLAVLFSQLYTSNVFTILSAGNILKDNQNIVLRPISETKQQ